MDNASPSKPAIKVRFYRFRNRLKEKTAGLGGGGNADGPLTIDWDALQKAEAALTQASEDYPDWVMATLQQLATLHQECAERPSLRRSHFDTMRRIAHDLIGQGGTFGYPLITKFAISLHGFANTRETIQDDHVEIVKIHIDAMRAVVRDRVSGPGGDIGSALTEGLKDAIRKVRASTKTR